MPDAELLQCLLKQGLFGALTIGKPVGKFKAVICLNTFNRIRKFLYNKFYELRRGIGAVFFVCF